MSEIVIDEINIIDCKIGFASYQKKSEFGPACITATNLKQSNMNLPYLVEPASRLILEGRQIAANQENVRDILYGAEYGKSSK